MAFSPTDAAFEGFRLTREKPLAILYWAAASLIIAVISTVLMILTIGPDMAALKEMGQTPAADPSAVAALFPAMGKLYAISIPVSLISSALFAGAAYRALFRPQDDRFGYLRFGADELRLILLYIVLLALFLLAMAAAVVLFGLVAAGIGFAAGQAGGGAGAAVGALVGVLGFLLILAAAAYFGVRISLAGPMTFVQRRLVIGSAWRLTRGHFWPLLGAYFLAWVLAVLVVLLGFAIVLAVAAAVGGGLAGVGQVTNPDFSTLSSYFVPATIAATVLSSFLTALQYAIVLTPPAVAYRELGEDAPAAADTAA